MGEGKWFSALEAFPGEFSGDDFGTMLELEVGLAWVIVPLKDIFNWTQTPSDLFPTTLTQQTLCLWQCGSLQVNQIFCSLLPLYFFFSPTREVQGQRSFSYKSELTFTAEYRKTWSSGRQQNSTHHNHCKPTEKKGDK